jgi:hypothetical protein
MRGSAPGDRATRWRALALLALAVAALGCCCPVLPPPTLTWQTAAAAAPLARAGAPSQPR